MATNNGTSEKAKGRVETARHQKIIKKQKMDKETNNSGRLKENGL